MAAPAAIDDYLRLYGSALGELVLARFPALHGPDDPVWPALKQLKRRPFPAQSMAIMGIVKVWQETRCAAAVAEGVVRCDPFGEGVLKFALARLAIVSVVRGFDGKCRLGDFLAQHPLPAGEVDYRGVGIHPHQ